MKRCCVLGLALAVLSLRAAAQDHTVFMDVAAENLFRYSRVLTFRSVPKSVEMVDPRVSARTAVIVENSNAEPFVTLVTGDRFTARLVVDGATRAPTQIEYTGQDRNPVVVTFSDRGKSPVS